MIQTYMAVMVGGALGSGARFFMSEWILQRWGSVFPWGTVLVNILGCLVIGLFAGLTGPDGVWNASPLFRQMVMIGVLGGFTTFSSFTLQTFQLFSSGHAYLALGNITASVVLCLAATGAGLALAVAIKSP